MVSLYLWNFQIIFRHRGRRRRRASQRWVRQFRGLELNGYGFPSAHYKLLRVACKVRYKERLLVPMPPSSCYFLFAQKNVNSCRCHRIHALDSIVTTLPVISRGS